ncbi:aldo/keto reductase [Histoplasma capsulatum var. duboisii H88]|uniref:Aldo/keto reductase n=1 Tax=Ajellomyces capsulatus (strain H88) TaxID=544711 RepID=F0UK38_AJEC8|nr:aldo/keto reductase [Histoplasma capsulatum var. duboisii H88]
MATIDSEIDVSAVKTRLLEGNASAIEYLQLESFVVPRLMIGLWQLSSPAWGFASKSKMLSQFQKHVDSGFTAYDMADHYGDAEIIFGQFRSSYSGPKSTFCATKYCVFEPITVTEDGMRNAVSQRLANIQSDKIDLLQFHWQDYNNSQYVRALQFLQDDERVAALGLCNFDTKRMEEVISVGVKVTTNQVQFSLIDARPTYAMAEACEKHHIKLLTYGTLYLEMINIWGSWLLFQTLLRTLSTIGRKHDVSVSAVAIRWVLDFSYVGAVIVGVRMGVSEHTEDNLAVYGWRLDAEDTKTIEEVLCQSRRGDMFSDMGDCGAEYRGNHDAGLRGPQSAPYRLKLRSNLPTDKPMDIRW